jgi:hypothetical protein
LSSTWSRNGAAHADAARVGERLQAGRDVDAVAEDVAVVDDDVADVDADAERDPALGRHAAVALLHAALYVHAAADGIDDARELDQEPVAHRLDDAPAVLGDLRIDQRAPVILEGREGAALVAAHQRRVADDVGGHDRGESSLVTSHAGNPRHPGNGRRRRRAAGDRRYAS